MTAQNAFQMGPMEHALRGVLLTVMSSDRSNEVVQTALGIACEQVVPEEAERARDFVERAIRLAVAGIIDEASAEAVLDGMNPILEMAGSRIRPTNAAARNASLQEANGRPSTAPTPTIVSRPSAGFAAKHRPAKPRPAIHCYAKRRSDLQRGRRQRVAPLRCDSRGCGPAYVDASQHRAAAFDAVHCHAAGHAR